MSTPKRRARFKLFPLPVAEDAPEGIEHGADAPRLRHRALTVAEASALDLAISDLKRAEAAKDEPSKREAMRALEAIYAEQILGAEGAIEWYAGDCDALREATTGAQIWAALDNRDGAELLRAMMGALTVAEGNS